MDVLIYTNTSYYKKVCEDVTVYWFSKYTTKLYDAFLSCSFWSWWSISKHILKHAAHFAKIHQTIQQMKHYNSSSQMFLAFGDVWNNHAASATSFSELRHERDVWPSHSNPMSFCWSWNISQFISNYLHQNKLQNNSGVFFSSFFSNRPMDYNLYNNSTSTEHPLPSPSVKLESVLLVVTIVSVQVLSDAQFMHSNSTYTHHLGEVYPSKQVKPRGGEFN